MKKYSTLFIHLPMNGVGISGQSLILYNNKNMFCKILIACILVLFVAGCDGPAEEAGGKVDQVVEQQRERIKDAEQQITEARKEIKNLQQELAQAKEERQHAEELLMQARQERQQALDEMAKITNQKSPAQSSKEQLQSGDLQSQHEDAAEGQQNAPAKSQ